MITIYGKPDCPYCVKAKDLCEKFGVDFKYVDLSLDDGLREDLLVVQGLRTVPQCFEEGGVHIGGYEDLFNHLLD